MINAKILGQSAPNATTLTDIYTVPASTVARVWALMVCNRDATATTYRFSIAPAGAAGATSQYVYYDIAIPANETLNLDMDIPLQQTDKVRVYAGNGNLTFSIYGDEKT